MATVQEGYKDKMLANFHTHTTFCDGESTAEEIVSYAIEKGFHAIGFSGHAYSDFDTTYCMRDTDAYIAEIKRLKGKYRNKIQVYLGAEEDIFEEVNRKDFEYIIGSSHYLNAEGKYYPIDSDTGCFDRCVEAFGGDILALAENYYNTFCEYILRRKPDIVGHFDLITKFDEVKDYGLLKNDAYNKIAEKYMLKALKSDCLFEVNTGAISRGYRKSPYPSENLLYVMKKNDAKLILSSDSHHISTLDYYFDESKRLLRDIGFEYVYTIYNNEVVRENL